jgi:triphosphatase
MPGSHPRYDLLHRRLTGFTRSLDGLEKGRIASVHHARVASRRLREVLPVLQLDAAVASHLGRRLRKVTRRLGTVRELDALLVLVDAYQESAGDDARALTRVVSAIGQERSAARDRLLARLPVTQLRRLASKLEKAAGALIDRETARGTARGWRWAIDARVAHRAALLKRSIETAGSVFLPGRVHEVRIAIKKLRYSVELEGELSPDKSWSHDLATLKRTQDLLGRLHDRQVLIERVRQVQASLTPPDLVVWRGLGSLVTTIENTCRRLHARYVRDAVALVALCDRVPGRTSGAPRARRAG